MALTGHIRRYELPHQREQNSADEASDKSPEQHCLNEIFSLRNQEVHRVSPPLFSAGGCGAGIDLLRLFRQLCEGR